MKKFHEEQLDQQVQINSNSSEQFQSEIRALKRLCEEKEDEVNPDLSPNKTFSLLDFQLYKQSSELRKCQDHLSVEMSKTNSYEHEQEQLQNTLQFSKEQIDKLQINLQQMTHHNEQLEYTINDLSARNDLIESKLIETMTVIDLRNKTVRDFDQQMEKFKIELIQKHKDLLDKQAHIDELEQVVIDKTAEVAELNETLETGLVKSHHREKFAEDNASKALHDVKVLQRDVRRENSPNISIAIVSSF